MKIKFFHLGYKRKKRIRKFFGLTKENIECIQFFEVFNFNNTIWNERCLTMLDNNGNVVDCIDGISNSIDELYQRLIDIDPLNKIRFIKVFATPDLVYFFNIEYITSIDYPDINHPNVGQIVLLTRWTQCFTGIDESEIQMRKLQLNLTKLLTD